MRDPAYVAKQRALIRRVDALWEQRVLTGPMIEQARAGDFILSIDFEDGRFTIAMYPRAAFAQEVPAGCRDQMLMAMAAGQPPLKMGETAAAWFMAAEWGSDEDAVVEVHGPVRAWRDSQGSA